MSDQERRFRAGTREQMQVLLRVLAEVALTLLVAVALVVTADLLRGRPLPGFDPLPVYLFVVLVAGLSYDRTRDVVLRSYGMIDGATGRVYPLDRMVSMPELGTGWLRGPRIGFDVRLSGILFGKDCRREWISVGQLPEEARQAPLVELREAFQRQSRTSAEPSESPASADSEE